MQPDNLARADLPGPPGQGLAGPRVLLEWESQVPPDLLEREHKARLVLRVLRDLRGQPGQRVLRETLVLRGQQVRQEIRALRAQRDRQEQELAVRQD